MTNKARTPGKTFLHQVLWGVLALGATAFLAATAVVHAHAELLSASPEPGATVTNPVQQIELVFSDPISAASHIILFGDDFKQIPAVSTTFDNAEPTVLKASVPQLAAGNYTVQFTAVSEDGHEISGSYTFRVSESNLPVSGQQLGIFGLGIILVVGIVVMWRRTRQQVSEQRQP